MKLFLLLALLSVPAFASKPLQVNLPVGTSTTVEMPSAVSGVFLDDPNLVEVKRQGRKLTFVGRSSGHTEATVRTAEGELRMRIYVAADRHGLP